MSTTYYSIKSRSDPHVPDPPCTQKTKHETHHTQAQSRKKLGRQQISARSSWVKVVDTSAKWWPTFGSTSLGGLLHRDWKCERTQPFPGEAPLACGNSAGLSALIRQWNILRKLLCHLVSNLLVNHLGLEHPQPVSSRVHRLSHQSRHGTTKVWTAPSHSAGVTIVTWSASPTTAPHGCSYKVQDRQWTGWRNSWNCCFAFTTACSCLYSLSTTAIHSTTSRSGWPRCRSFGGTLLNHHHTAPRKGLHRKRFYKLEVSKKSWTGGVLLMFLALTNSLASHCFHVSGSLLRKPSQRARIWCVAFEHKHMQPLRNAPEGPVIDQHRQSNPNKISKPWWNVTFIHTSALLQFARRYEDQDPCWLEFTCFSNIGASDTLTSSYFSCTAHTMAKENMPAISPARKETICPISLAYTCA